ncbi:hypothetical protein K6W36_12555 [Acetobacter senegalensis]|uniref:hypothetical protein n=1 Tax=Acetobacter senegalensis TaxID=446692 RepID=UPI001EDABA99|nr:hypothetical protein [Acetobacter senegalensis]MCG4261397.1 hypothetical protein [Acetobacter senegalensis]
MSGTNSTATTQSGVPISSLPAAQDVAANDGVFGVFGGEAKLADPKKLVAAGLPDDVVKTDDLNAALSDSSLGQYADQAAKDAADAKLANASAQATEQRVTQQGQQIANIVVTVQPIAITDADVTAYLFGLPTTDKNEIGTCWNNSGIITVSAAGIGQPALVVGGIRPAQMNWWFNNLPEIDPVTPGSWYDNAGIPTLSSAGLPTTITVQTQITDALWCEFIAGLAQPNGAIPTDTTGQWLNNSGVAVRN